MTSRIKVLKGEKRTDNPTRMDELNELKTYLENNSRKEYEEDENK